MSAEIEDDEIFVIATDDEEEAQEEEPQAEKPQEDPQAKLRDDRQAVSERMRAYFEHENYTIEQYRDEIDKLKTKA
jgi:hypothetical protein